MSHATKVANAPAGPGRRSPILFQSLVLTDPEKHGARTSATILVSMVLHSALVIAVAIVPLIFYDALPSSEGLKAFFVAPLEIAPPPPPPPPPPAGARAVVRQAPRIETPPPQGFVAPIEVPNEITPEESMDLGIEGGVAGGVEGGVPGGVVGGVVGGLPSEAPPRRPGSSGSAARSRSRRRSATCAPPTPTSPSSPASSALVILEAEVDVRGYVSRPRSSAATRSSTTPPRRP